MKPNFALNLTDDSITLLRRGVEGWQIVGHTPFNVPDLPATLGELRAKAEALAPEGVSTKLVIPNSQILYTEVEAHGPSEEERQAQIATALEEITPYKAGELAFDYNKTGDRILVAAVAIETLHEAEDFAQSNGFNPVSFVANPQNAFRFEPWLGRTRFADDFLPEGEIIERDFELLEIEETEDLPEVSYIAIPSEKVEPIETLEESDLTLTIPAAAEEEVAPKPEAPLEQETASEIIAPRDVFAALPPAGAPFPLDIRPLAAQSADEAPFADVKDPVSEAAAQRQAAEIAKDEDTASAPERRIHIDRESRSGSRRAPSLWLDELPEEELPQPTPSSVLLRALAARRAAAPPSGISTPPPQSLRAAAQDQIEDNFVVSAPLFEPNASIKEAFDDSPMTLTFAPPPLKVNETVFTTPTKAEPEEIIVPAESKPEVVEVPVAKATKLVPPPLKTPKVLLDEPELNLPELDAQPQSEKIAPLSPPPVLGAPAPLGRSLSVKAPPKFRAKASEETVKAAKARLNLFKTTGFGNAKPAAEPKPKPKAKPQPIVNEAAQTAVESLSKSPFMPQKRGKPRHLGLIMSAGLMLCLAGVAAWSSFSGDSPAESQEVQQPAVQPSVESTGLPAPDPAPVQSDASAQEAPQRDEILVAEIDAPPAASQAQGLPAPEAQTEVPPESPMPPPAFGTVYERDADGLLVPQPGGILTPEGYTLFAGKPKLLPEPRPAAVEAAARAAQPEAEPVADPIADPVAAPLETPTAPEAAPVPEATNDNAAQPNPELIRIKPRARPQALAPPASAQEPASLQEDATLTPEAAGPVAPPAEEIIQQAKFDGPRPPARPANIAAAAQSARDQAAAASLLAASSPEQPVQVEDGPGGLTISLRPMQRPRNFVPPVGAVAVASVSAPAVDAAVNAAMKEAASSQSRTTQEEADEIDEPETPRSAPKIPTKASVAKQATQTKAINLSKLSLIGIYGANSNRYAMVRTKNGKFTKVKVGDRLDGGRVQAITQSEVRYQKGSNMLALAMP